MDLVKRYSVYHFKKTLIRFAVILLYCLVVVNFGIHESFDSWDGETYHYFSLGCYGVSMLFMCFVVAVMEFAEFKNRRNLDSWFSFPLDRWKIALIHYVNGAVEIFTAHTLSFILGYCKLLPFVKECDLDMSGMFPMFFLILIMGLCYYGFLLFPFIVANNTFDGIFFAVLYSLIPSVIISILTAAFGIRNLSEYSVGLGYGLIDEADRCQNNLTRNMSNWGDVRYKSLEGGDIASIIIWCVIGATVFAAAVYMFNNLKTEKVGGPSDSIFGYRTLIPIYMFSLVLLWGGTVGFGIIYGIATFLLYVVLRRGVKLKLPDIIIIVIVTILANIPVNYVYEFADLIGRNTWDV